MGSVPVKVHMQDIHIRGVEIILKVRDEFVLDCNNVLRIFHIDWIAVADTRQGPVGVLGRDAVDVVVPCAVVFIINALQQQSI